MAQDNNPATGQPAQPAPLNGGKLALGTLVLSLATFMNVLDTSIANVSLPAIAGNLGVSPNQATWVITSFAVANAISIPLTGWPAWPWQDAGFPRQGGDDVLRRTRRTP